MDELDKSIAYILMQDARQTYTQIAEEVNSTKSTVANRIQKMIDDGDIDRISASMNLEKHGGTHLFLFLSGITTRSIGKIREILDEDLCIIRYFATAGEFGLIAEFYSPQKSDANEILGKLSAYCTVKTDPITLVKKKDFIPL